MNTNKKGIIICAAVLFLLCAILFVKGIWAGRSGDSTEVVNHVAQGQNVTGESVKGENATGVPFTVAAADQETPTEPGEKKDPAGKGKQDGKENEKSGKKPEAEADNKKDPSDTESDPDVKNASKSSSKAKDEKQKPAGKKSSSKKGEGKADASVAKKDEKSSAGSESGGGNAPPEASSEPTRAPQEENKKPECSLTVTCAEVFSHMDQLSESAKKVIPADGIMIQGTYEFTQGDTVFDVLKRVCAEKKIHLDYVFTPLYGNYYIKGIHNLYEFDCGDESGWMYSVNGTDPGCGCSQYKLSKGDQIRFNYTCEY